MRSRSLYGGNVNVMVLGNLTSWNVVNRCRCFGKIILCNNLKVWEVGYHTLSLRNLRQKVFFRKPRCRSTNLHVILAKNTVILRWNYNIVSLLLILCYGSISSSMQEHVTLHRVTSLRQTWNKITFCGDCIFFTTHTRFKCSIFAKYIISRVNFHISASTYLLCCGLCTSMTSRQDLA
jgi:hypothetical protein